MLGKQTELLAQIIIGGILVAGTSYISRYISPEYAGIFWSFPVSLIAVYFFFIYNKEKNKNISKFFVTTMIGLINVAAFCLPYGIIHYKDPKIHPLVIFMISLSTWGITALGTYFIIERVMDKYY